LGGGAQGLRDWRSDRFSGKTGRWTMSSTKTRTSNLAKPNFEFQKRQKELEKKRKKEEKKQKKLDRAAAQAPAADSASTPTESS
jgi:Skp family chaperone for outer membrane proteins